MKGSPGPASRYLLSRGSHRQGHGYLLGETKAAGKPARITRPRGTSATVSWKCAHGQHGNNCPKMQCPCPCHS